VGSSKKQTIGYEYYMGMHMALCHGPIDTANKVFVDGRLAWSGGSTGGTITIDAPELFGGEKKEGGISGTVDFEFGESTQAVNTYLSGQLGADTPAFRGVMCAVLNQCYMGNNPYLKPWSFDLSRIHVLEDGSEQWYDAKAEVARAEVLATHVTPTTEGWRYLQLAHADTTDYSSASFDDSSWDTGQTPFSNAAGHVYTESEGYPAISNHTWTLNTRLWLRRTINLGTTIALTLEIFSDNYATVWINGILVLARSGASTGSPTGPDFTHFVNVPTSALVIGTNVIAVLAEDTGTLNYVALKIVSELQASDMNPAHIIREALTQSWGLGYAASDIDDTSFEDAADTLFDERMGISILWDKEIGIEDFINQIKQHINAELYISRSTGKFVLKLIRDDYTVGSSLLVLDENNAKMAGKARRPSIGELVTSVTVQFTDALSDDEKGSVTVHNQALIQMQGIERGSTAQYIGFSDRSIATRVALRDLKALSTPLLSAEVAANREAATLNIGDVFVLDFPEQGINSLVMRVQTISVGDGLDNSVVIRCIEDVFSAPPVSAVYDDEIRWTDPINAGAEPASPRLVMEAPYYELAQEHGQADVDAALIDDPDMGFIAVTAGRQGNEFNADLLTDSGAGFVDLGVLDFAAYATLAIDAWYSDANLYYSSGNDMSGVSAGDLAQIGEEIIRFDALGSDSNGTFLTVGRGVLDTAPAEHLAGASIVFFDLASDEVRYTASDSIDVKLRTRLGSSVSFGEPVDTVVMDSRAIRPYPPGNLEVDGFSYPVDWYYLDDSILSWAHRDRAQQTSGTVFDYLDGDIGPEAGTTYIVRADGILANETITAEFVNQNVGSATTYAHGASSGVPISGSEFVRWKVYSVRDGYESWQPAMVVIPRTLTGDLWTPLEITTSLWLDASDAATITTDTTGRTSQWSDKSGNARHATQSTDSQRPITNLITQNSLNVLEFNGASQQYFTISDLSGLTEATVFLVVKTSNDPAINIRTGLWTFTNGGIHSHFPFTDSTIYDSFGTTVRKSTINPTPAMTQWNIYAVNSRSGEWTQRINGTQPYTTATNTFGIGATSYIGRSFNSTSYWYDGLIAEMVIVPDGNLVSGTRQRIEGYLAWKWGRQSVLASDHLFKNAAPRISSS